MPTPESFRLDGSLAPLGQWRNPVAGPCSRCHDANRGEHVHPDDAHVSRVTFARMLCDGCADAMGLAPCSACADWRDTEYGGTDFRGGWHCGECVDVLKECERCHVLAHPDDSDGWQEVDGDSWCGECVSEHADFCDGCQGWTDNRHTSFCESCDVTTCEECSGAHNHSDLESAERAYYTPADVSIVPTMPTYPDGSDMTVGVEIECTMPAYPFDWDAKEDGSLKGPGDFETCSPILEGTDGLCRLRAAVAAMKAEGCEPCNGGGVHVHVGTRDHYRTLDVLRIVESWEQWGEHVVAGIIPGYRLGAKSYNKPVSASIMARTGSIVQSTLVRQFLRGQDMPAGDIEWARRTGSLVTFPTGDRNVSQNLRAMYEHGTIEYRLFPSTVNSEHVTTYAAFMACFTASAVRHDPARVRALCDRYGAFRAGVRIVARGNPVLRDSMLRMYGARMVKGDQSKDHDSHPSRKPFGRKGADTMARMTGPADRAGMVATRA